jgi:hypothetical protein
MTSHLAPRRRQKLRSTSVGDALHSESQSRPVRVVIYCCCVAAQLGLIAGVSQAARLSLQQKLQQLRALRRCAISFKNSTVQAQLGDVYNNIFSEAFQWRATGKTCTPKPSCLCNQTVAQPFHLESNQRACVTVNTRRKYCGVGNLKKERSKPLACMLRQGAQRNLRCHLLSLNQF